MKDVIIIGRGLAGATLSFQLIAKGINHRIVDKPSLSSSSKVAAGLVNPIVLKRLKMVQGASEYMTKIPYFYKDLEARTLSKFYNETSIHHIFANPGEINLWEEKKDIPFHSQYLQSLIKNNLPDINAPHGLGIMSGVGWLDTEEYLKAHKKYCELNNISINDSSITEAEVSERANEGHTIILCNGHLLKDWNLLPSKIFNPTRGEVMIISADGLPNFSILHSSIFTIPLGDSKFKVGATYHWDNLNDKTSHEALERLKSDLEKIYSGKYTVIEHQAGVRPNIIDRKPIIGRISHNIMVFNGMGSRAALMTPFLSNLLIKHLTGQTALPPQFDIARFL